MTTVFFGIRPLLGDPGWKPGMPIDRDLEQTIIFLQGLFGIGLICSVRFLLLEVYDGQE
jgi:hypothetical protein